MTKFTKIEAWKFIDEEKDKITTTNPDRQTVVELATDNGKMDILLALSAKLKNHD